MDRIELKELVRRAIEQRWEDFAAEHPHLAAVIDQDLLVERAVAEIGRDPEYIAAMEAAAIAGTVALEAARVIGAWIDRALGSVQR